MLGEQHGGPSERVGRADPGGPENATVLRVLRPGVQAARAGEVPLLPRRGVGDSSAAVGWWWWWH